MSGYAVREPLALLGVADVAAAAVMWGGVLSRTRTSATARAGAWALAAGATLAAERLLAAEPAGVRIVGHRGGPLRSDEGRRRRRRPPAPGGTLDRLRRRRLGLRSAAGASAAALAREGGLHFHVR